MNHSHSLSCYREAENGANTINTATPSSNKCFGFYLFIIFVGILSQVFARWKKKMKVLVAQSCLTLCNPMAPLSLEFSRQPFPSPGDLPDPGIKPKSPARQAASSPAEPSGELCVRSFLSFSLPSSFHSTKNQYVGSIFFLLLFWLFKLSSFHWQTLNTKYAW